MDKREALDNLSHDAGVDARLVVLVDYVELLLGGAEGTSYSDSERDGLRTSILQLLALRWAQGRPGRAWTVRNGHRRENVDDAAF